MFFQRLAGLLGAEHKVLALFITLPFKFFDVHAAGFGETDERGCGIFVLIEGVGQRRTFALDDTFRLFVGYTSGAVMQAIKQYAAEGEFNENSNVIAIFPDHGSRYMSKVFSDEWMNEQGFFDSINAEEVQKIEFIK